MSQFVISIAALVLYRFRFPNAAVRKILLEFDPHTTYVADFLRIEN
ncbi:hypothetical protein [Paraburkholderia dinghuensis]|nr:hypothetical protein [Paraburkholderia dinghuensis]